MSIFSKLINQNMPIFEDEFTYDFFGLLGSCRSIDFLNSLFGQGPDFASCINRNWNDILYYILFINARAALVCACMELAVCAD